ncbi:hypothetical protein ACFY64_00480 [Streptomyces collinus]|uniref:hypothetical protein n=1 Tax=Streptomyces collinus TaxID=42684 RepID=UPI003689B931
MRRAAALLLGLSLLWPAAPASAADRTPAERAPTGWAAARPGTTGGAGGRTRTVDTRAELKAAFANPADVYGYRALTSPAAVEPYVLRHAGAGRPYGRP